MKLNRISPLAAALLALTAPALSFAQAPPTAPLVLTISPSARVAALGGAWVAGRDQDVIFYNPAQLIGSRTDFSVTVARLGEQAHMASMQGGYAGGRLSFTLGWGLQVINFRAIDGIAPPFTTDVFRRDESLLLPRPTADAQSAVATVGGAVLYKGFRAGAAVKYAADRSSANHHALLADFGLARNLLGGAIALAVQNVGNSTLDGTSAKIPRQVALGYSKARIAGPLDIAFTAQVSHRAGWNSAAAGFEAGYSWIEGMSITGRAGLRRPETKSENPLSLGGAFTADRVTLEYALQMFDNSKRSHLVTLRWR